MTLEHPNVPKFIIKEKSTMRGTNNMYDTVVGHAQPISMTKNSSKCRICKQWNGIATLL